MLYVTLEHNVSGIGPFRVHSEKLEVCGSAATGILWEKTLPTVFALPGKFFIVGLNS